MSQPLLRDGLLPLNKPVGPTSHDIVAILRRTLGIRSVGHTGTLDPFASGLLLLCIGRATRLAEYLGAWPKEYSARARLGIQTTTDDGEGEVISESNGWEGLSREEIAATLSSFLGESEQRPPDYSAKKVRGKAAYALARHGKEVDLPTSRVRIHSMELLEIDLPWVDFKMICSTGTYVRALARDLGERLRVGAHLTELRRLGIGPFSVDQALSLDDLSNPAALEEGWISPLQALSHLPRVEVMTEEAGRIRMGQPLLIEEDRIEGGEGGRVYSGGDEGVSMEEYPREVALSLSGELVATARLEGNLLRPRKVFHE